jgi:hypothetical protein
MTTTTINAFVRLTPLALMTMLLGACSTSGGLLGTRGEGAVKSETRQSAAFSHLDVSNGIRVAVRIGPAEPLVVRAQENLLPLIATEVLGDTLRIHSTHSYTTSETIEITIVTPTLNGITMSGGSHGQIDGLAVDRFDADLSGGAVVSAAGTASSVSLGVSGGSRAEFADLATKTVRVDLSGGSNATIRASEQVNGSASGGAHATVLGKATISVSTTGGSSATRQ